MAHVLFALLVLGLLPLSVSAHGYIGSVSIDGKSYPGNVPGGATNPSVIRQVSTISPVKGASNPSLNCGMNATLAANVASANPGSQVLVHWVGGATGDSNWPHETGPIMHYMAKCSGTCSSYDSTSAEWFKISELGVEPGGNTWYQAGIAAGQPANVTIPSTIASGNYLLRSELISLQLAVSVGGAEFYPGCIQLSIGGSGSGAPKSGETCAFPGGYSDNDPGIYDPNIFNPPLTYTFPGPPVASFVGSGASQGGSQPSGSGSSGSSATPAGGSSSPAPSASSMPASTYSSSHSSPSNSSPLPSSPSYSSPSYSSPSYSSAHSPSPTVATAATTSPSATQSRNPHTLEASCYVTPRSTQQSLTKRGSKKEIHKRRLVRRGT